MNDQPKKESHLRFIFRMLEGSKHLFVISILATGITALVDMLTPQVIRLAIDNVIGKALPEADSWQERLYGLTDGFVLLREKPWILAGVIMVLALLRVFTHYTHIVFSAKASETFVNGMRNRLFSHIERLPYSWHASNHTGDIIQRCTSDVDMVRNFVSQQLVSIFRIVLMIVLSAVFMLKMNVTLSLICMLPFPFVLAYSIRFHTKIKEGFKNCDENEGKLSAMVQENLTGVRVVRAFGREKYERDRFEAHNEYYTGLWAHLAKVMSRYWSSQDFFCGLQVMLVVVLGAVFCVRGKLSAGAYVAFISYNASLSDPMRYLGRMISEMSKAGVSIDRIRAIMDAEEEKDLPDCVTPAMDGDISFDHVSFAYEAGKNILKDVTFTMRAGTTLGILGGTGSGKSTLTLLLDKLYDLPAENGTISVGGTDIRRIKTAHLRQNIGIVLQEPYLFSRSIRDNILIASPEREEEKLKDAARTACLDHAIEGFSEGYDTFVGERGVTLSGGQKQRAAIARMLAQNTPIMIFDDSLSAVDTRTDAEIRRNLQKRFGTASIILISHRITTLSKADLILVLDEGKIAEMGTHEQLIARNGIYRRIYDIQSGSGEEAAV